MAPTFNLAKPHRIAPVFLEGRRIRIGILGGSFNPAHEGHGHIADLAVRHLRLDELWWLVTPGNPLKKGTEMLPFEERFDTALHEANKCRYARRMVVSRLEAQLGTNRSAKTLNIIRRKARRAKLIWVMGSDNLAEFHRWFRPGSIHKYIPIAVVNRPGSRNKALSGAGARVAGQRVRTRRLELPSERRRWCFIQGPLSHASATAIRAGESIR